MRNLKLNVIKCKDGSYIVNLSMPLHDLSHIMDCAEVHMQDEKSIARAENDDDGLKHYTGMVAFIQGLRELWRSKISPRVDLLTLPKDDYRRSKARRLKDVLEQIKERKFFENLMISP